MDPLGVAVLVLTWSIKVQVEPILDLVIQSSSGTYFWIGFEFDVSDLINKRLGSNLAYNWNLQHST